MPPLLDLDSFPPSVEQVHDTLGHLYRLVRISVVAPVAAEATSTIVTGNGGPLVGDGVTPYTYTATVSNVPDAGDTPGGTVDFLIDGVLHTAGIALVAGVATCDIVWPDPGAPVTRNVDVNYHSSDTAHWSNSSGSKAVQVTSP